MISLLESYTDADASSAIEDARECVRTAVVDPQSLSFDHVARLPAVRLLQQSDPLMHNALEIFTTGNLKDYKVCTQRCLSSSFIQVIGLAIVIQKRKRCQLVFNFLSVKCHCRHS